MKVNAIGVNYFRQVKNINYKRYNINTSTPQFTPKLKKQDIQNNPTLQVIPRGQQISFGYKHVIKDMFKAGVFGDKVKVGLYGDILTKENCSLEHIIPHSLNGASSLHNYALASVAKNNARGNRPITEFLTKDLAINYLEQFKDIVVEHNGYKFDGNNYIKLVSQTLKKAGLDILEHFKEL